MKNISKLIVSIASVLIGMLLMPMMLFGAEGTLTGLGTESNPYIIKQRMILRVYKMELREESLIKINIFG